MPGQIVHTLIASGLVNPVAVILSHVQEAFLINLCGKLVKPGNWPWSFKAI